MSHFIFNLSATLLVLPLTLLYKPFQSKLHASSFPIHIVVGAISCTILGLPHTLLYEPFQFKRHAFSSPTHIVVHAILWLYQVLHTHCCTSHFNLSATLLVLPHTLLCEPFQFKCHATSSSTHVVVGAISCTLPGLRHTLLYEPFQSKCQVTSSSTHIVVQAILCTLPGLPSAVRAISI